MDAATGSQITTYKPLGKNISTIAALPDGKSLLLGYEDGTLPRWNMHTAESLWTANEHKLGINQPQLSKDARFAITAGLDGQVMLWDTEHGNEAHRIPPYPYHARSEALTQDPDHT